MLSMLKGHVSDAAAPFIFVVLFLVIVGAALWLTPRLAKWLDERESANKSYYDGMLTEDPNASKNEDETEDEEKNGKAD